MKALVVYHSEYGNTTKIAQAIAEGLREGGLADVVVKNVENVTPADFKEADLWVAGSPTHIGNATGEIKRALKQAIADMPGHKSGVAFDTRFKDSPKGGSSRIEQIMREGGLDVVVLGENFAVLKSKGPLAEGEEAKAKAFGKKIAASVTR